MKALCCAIALAILSVSEAGAMTITSEAPGNLFVAGQAPRFAVSDQQGAVSWRLVSYGGRQVARGEAQRVDGRAEVALAPLPPGWYELRCRDEAGEATATLGVVIDRGNQPLPEAGRVCGDAATAWLVGRDEDLRPFARMLRLAGIPWVRERLSWSATQPAPDRVDWGRYQLVADALAAEGLHVYQIWHDSPPWTRPGNDATRCPDDLRTVYRYARMAAAHFAEQISAWEVWNEPDVGFWPDLSDRYGGLFKAAALGLHDGNPRARLLPGSLCIGPGAFARALWQDGAGSYCDTFNWHIYNQPATYPATLAGHRQILAKHGLAGLPAWLTEAGIGLMGTEGKDKRFLSPADQRLQCRFLPPSVVMSLAAGDDKHFFFVLPDYLENGRQFGTLKPDLTPYPSFLALSAAANILGLGEYLGELKPDALPHRLRAGGKDRQTAVHLFATPQGTVAVAWADSPALLRLPAAGERVAVADIFGATKQAPVKDGQVAVRIGPEAVYVIGLGDAVKQGLVPGPARLRPPAAPRLPRLVVVGHAALAIDKGANAYQFRADTIGKPFEYTVEVYNFDEARPAAGRVRLALPGGWQVSPATGRVVVGPLGRQVLTFTVTPAAAGLAPVSLAVVPEFGRQAAAPCHSYFLADPAAAVPLQRRALSLLPADRWQPSASANGTVAVTDEAGGLRVQARFTAPGDRWAYPILPCEPPLDLSGYDGIAFDLAAEPGQQGQIRLMLVEANGAHYVRGVEATGSRRVVLLFEHFEHMDFMGPDPNERLDLGQIKALKLGCNTGADRFAFTVRNAELVKLPR